MIVSFDCLLFLFLFVLRFMNLFSDSVGRIYFSCLGIVEGGDYFFFLSFSLMFGKFFENFLGLEFWMWV